MSSGVPRRILRIASGVIVAATIAGAGFDDLFEASPDHPAIGYQQPASDPVARLSRRIAGGAVQLNAYGPSGYLRSLLQLLDVPVESQIVVFSKTSFQSARISPGNPRTLFFNDAVAVGWVRGGFIELAAQDPRQGTVFYTLDQSGSKPTLTRRDDCLTCHLSFATLGVPGMLMRSVFPRPDGLPLRPLGDYLSDHRSPFPERWGGWYVTGDSGSLRHMGNATVLDAANTDGRMTNQIRHVESLQDKFETADYLSTHSDIVALMIFQHQIRAQNLITRLGWETRLSESQGDNGSRLSARIRPLANELADYLLFVGEPPLHGPIRGNSGFAEKFAAIGPRDKKGRSLRQLDLERRLFKFPCSYMINTEAFDSLPARAQAAAYSRIFEILLGREKDSKYSHLSTADRAAILEILRETKTDADRLP